MTVTTPPKKAEKKAPRETIKAEQLRRELYHAGYLPAAGGWKRRVRFPRVETLYMYGLELRTTPGGTCVLIDLRTDQRVFGPRPACEVIDFGMAMIRSGGVRIMQRHEAHSEAHGDESVDARPTIDRA